MEKLEEIRDKDRDYMDGCIRRELEAAGIRIVELDDSEGLSYTLVGRYGPWHFERRWNGRWYARADVRQGLPAAVAEKLNRRWRKEVHVGEWEDGADVSEKLSKFNTINTYGIVTLSGLKAFALLIDLYVEDPEGSKWDSHQPEKAE